MTKEKGLPTILNIIMLLLENLIVRMLNEVHQNLKTNYRLNNFQ